METTHRSVLTEEIIHFLQPKDGGMYLDATFGGGGHSRVILGASGPSGKVVAFDRDSEVMPIAKKVAQLFPARFEFVTKSYAAAAELTEKFDGAVFDLGLSSDQLAQTGRGFSFEQEQVLDMRFDQTHGMTAADVLNQTSQPTLQKIFSELAQDRYAGGLSKKIVERRKDNKFRTTTDFNKVIGTSSPKILAPLYQALRITVNDELNTLKRGLEAVRDVLNIGAVIVVISFHSGEDRIVKQFFLQPCFEVLTKKPITASDSELLSNPRSRSAKLRAARLIKESQS